MTQWSKQTLESYYQANLTDNDWRIINEEFEGMTWEDIEADTRLFKDISDYAYNVYYDEDDRSNFINLLSDLAIEEPNTQYTVRELLLGDEAVELEEGKIIMIMG